MSHAPVQNQATRIRITSTLRFELPGLQKEDGSIVDNDVLTVSVKDKTSSECSEGGYVTRETSMINLREVRRCHRPSSFELQGEHFKNTHTTGETVMTLCAE